MGITDFGKQLRPKPYRAVNHVEKIQSLFEADEIQVAVDELLPTSATDRTQIYEAAVVLVAMAGPDLNSSKIKSVMKNDEFSSVAKSWTASILNEKRNDEVLSEWYANIGYPISKLGKFEDFIHENINQYYPLLYILK